MSSSSSYWLRSSASWRSSPVIGRTASGAVGVLYRWWKWDTLWQCSLSIFQWGCRGYECAAESLLLQPQEALQLRIACPIIQSPKKLIKHPRGICCYTFFFFLRHFFCLFGCFFFLKVTACVNERPCHFLLTTYLRFCVAFARLCSISKDLLARWKAQQRQRSHKGKRDACVVKFPRGIFSWYWPERRRTGFYSDSRRAREKKGAPRGRKKRERESSECCLWFARRSRDCSGSDGSASLFFSPFSLPGSARLVSPLLWAQVIGWTSIPAPEAAPVAGLRPARPSRLNPPWICTSTPPPAHASSSPCHWRRPWRDWRGDCRKDSKSQKRDSLCYTKKRE